MRFATDLWKSEGQPATSGQRFQPEGHVQDQAAGMSQVDVGNLNTSTQPNYQKPPLCTLDLQVLLRGISEML